VARPHRTGSAPGSYTNTAVGFGCQGSSEAGCNNSNHDATATSSVATVIIAAAASPGPSAGPSVIPSQPPTDALGSTGTSGPADVAWLLVVALGVLLASAVILVAAKARSRR
jgi:hypothetical protein